MTIDQDRIYQRIGEFVVSFQWLEHRIREMGWFLLDPGRTKWPPTQLRTDRPELLFNEVEKLFLEALPRCRLDAELEASYRESLPTYAKRFHKLRKARNKILHSAFIELKAGHEVQALLRSNPRLTPDSETGELLYDQEILSERSFNEELRETAEVAVFINRCYVQLIHRLPINEDA